LSTVPSWAEVIIPARARREASSDSVGRPVFSTLTIPPFSIPATSSSAPLDSVINPDLPRRTIN
jgi:hypothetical protein